MSRAVDVWVRVVEDGHGVHLTHDLPCRRCGHAPHRYLPCDQHVCDCSGDLG